MALNGVQKDGHSSPTPFVASQRLFPFNFPTSIYFKRNFTEQFLNDLNNNKTKNSHFFPMCEYHSSHCLAHDSIDRILREECVQFVISSEDAMKAHVRGIFRRRRASSNALAQGSGVVGRITATKTKVRYTDFITPSTEFEDITTRTHSAVQVGREELFA